MINTTQDLQDEFLVRGARTTSTTDITDAMINDWTREAALWCAAYKKWPFTEGRVSTTFTSLVTQEDGYLVGEFPENWKPDSIRLLTIGGKEVEKKNFYSFRKFLEDNTSTKDRIYSDFGMRYFVNPSIDVSGTVTAWGQFTPALDPTDKTSVTVFSNNAEEGNEAIVEMMLFYLKRRDKLFDESKNHRDTATAILDELYKRYQDEQFAYQQTRDDGMFKRMDLLKGALRDDTFKRDQFY